MFIIKNIVLYIFKYRHIHFIHWLLAFGLNLLCALGGEWGKRPGLSDLQTHRHLGIKHLLLALHPNLLHVFKESQRRVSSPSHLQPSTLASSIQYVLGGEQSEGSDHSSSNPSILKFKTLALNRNLSHVLKTSPRETTCIIILHIFITSAF